MKRTEISGRAGQRRRDLAASLVTHGDEVRDLTYSMPQSDWHEDSDLLSHFSALTIRANTKRARLVLDWAQAQRVETMTIRKVQ